MKQNKFNRANATRRMKTTEFNTKERDSIISKFGKMYKPNRRKRDPREENLPVRNDFSVSAGNLRKRI